MKKQELRAMYLEKRKLLTAEEIAFFSDKIFKNLKKTFPLNSGCKLHVFISIQKFNEINTQQFMSEMMLLGVRIFVPKVIGSELINVEVFPDTVFETSAWGISEPVENIDSGESFFDYIVTPLLYCDPNGNRIGYGKGFYDRLFQKISGVKIGINYFEPKEIIVNPDPTDIPLDYLITPDNVLSFVSL